MNSLRQPTGASVTLDVKELLNNSGENPTFASLLNFKFFAAVVENQNLHHAHK